MVVAVEECQLLRAVSGVIEHIDVQGHFTRRLVERVDKPLDEPIFQPQQGRRSNGVLEPRQGGLAGEIVILRQAIGQQLKDGIRAQGIMIVLIFVASEDPKQATANHLQRGVLRIASRVAELLCKAFGKPLLLVPLPKDQQASIRREILVDRLHADRFFGQKIEHQLPHIV